MRVRAVGRDPPTAPGRTNLRAALAALRRTLAEFWRSDAGSARVFPARFALLDGVRGLAALGVVLAHHDVAVFGHQAVLVFFVVSGYCIAGAADAALAVGSSGAKGLRAFMWRRIRRIYPPYLLALLFFAATRVIRQLLHRGEGLPADLLVWLQNLTLTQWLTLVRHPAAEPVANPSLLVTAFWSLNYEEQFYLVVAVAVLTCAARVERLPVVLGAVTIASALWLAIVGSETFYGLFFEFWPHFAIGAGLFIVLHCASDRRSRTLFALSLALLMLLSAVSAAGALPGAVSRLAGEFTLLGGVGLVLLFLRPYSERVSAATWWRPVALLGTISYSLYLVHQFNLTLANTFGRLVAPGGPSWLQTTVAIAVQVVIATLFWYVCERPFLNRPGPPRAERHPDFAFVAARATLQQGR